MGTYLHQKVKEDVSSKVLDSKDASLVDKIA